MKLWKQNEVQTNVIKAYAYLNLDGLCTPVRILLIASSFLMFVQRIWNSQY